jgi:hypothetical protein
MAWNNLKIRTCIATYDVLTQISWAGAVLPDGLVLEELKMGDTLMAAAEKVAGDDALWAALPQRIVPPREAQTSMAEMAKEIGELSGVPLDMGAIGSMVEAVQQGEARDELRRKLRSYVEESR